VPLLITYINAIALMHSQIRLLIFQFSVHSKLFSVILKAYNSLFFPAMNIMGLESRSKFLVMVRPYSLEKVPHKLCMGRSTH
jgi:hypothetical protein